LKARRAAARAAHGWAACRLGALSGILATVAFPPLHRRLGLPATAALSIWLQLACLLAAAAPSVAAAAGAGVGPRPRLYCLVWGLVLSRFGLWSFDLAANQLIQETADASRLGQVTGVQNSMQSAFQVGGRRQLSVLCMPR
jgi:iron-regulated transporter 1